MHHVHGGESLWWQSLEDVVCENHNQRWTGPSTKTGQTEEFIHCHLERHIHLGVLLEGFPFDFSVV